MYYTIFQMTKHNDSCQMTYSTVPSSFCQKNACCSYSSPPILTKCIQIRPTDRGDNISNACHRQIIKDSRRTTLNPENHTSQNWSLHQRRYNRIPIHTCHRIATPTGHCPNGGVLFCSQNVLFSNSRISRTMSGNNRTLSVERELCELWVSTARTPIKTKAPYWFHRSKSWRSDIKRRMWLWPDWKRLWTAHSLRDHCVGSWGYVLPKYGLDMLL